MATGGRRGPNLITPKSAPLRMSLHGATGYAPGLSAPRCPNSVLAPNFLGGIPSANARVLFCLPTCLLQGRGGQKLQGVKTPVCCKAKAEAGSVHDEPSSPSRPHSYEHNVRIILFFERESQEISARRRSKAPEH